MIRNLVFDVGGVLLEYRWQDMFCLLYTSDAADE